MSSKVLSIIVLSMVFFSACRKDERAETLTTSSIVSPDEINPTFSKTKLTLSSSSLNTGYIKGCDYNGFVSGYSWKFNYKFGEGFEREGKVFYPIQKKWDVTGNINWQGSDYLEEYQDPVAWQAASDWHTTDKFYRYDSHNKKSYLYEGVDDETPLLLMDFNLDWGDAFLIDAQYQIYFCINERITVTNNGIEYPAYRGRFEFKNGTSDWQYSHWEFITEISPFNPNPYRMVEDFKKVDNHEWSIFRNELYNEQPEQWIPEGAKGNDWGYGTYVNIICEPDSSVRLNNLPATYVNEY